MTLFVSITNILAPLFQKLRLILLKHTATAFLSGPLCTYSWHLSPCMMIAQPLTLFLVVPELFLGVWSPGL